MLKKPVRVAALMIALLAFNLLPAMAELLGLGSFGILWFGFNVLGVVFVLIAMLAALLARKPRDLRNAATVGATLLLSAYPCLRLTVPARTHAFWRLAERSRPLVRAIEAYTRERGAPPAALHDLVPKHLDAIRGTGMLGYPAYEYTVFPADVPVLLRWYDLGSRGGAPFSGLWKYPDGDRGHAILVLETSRDGVVREATLDRAAPVTDPLPFDAETWRTDKSARMRMVADLKRHGVATGKHVRDVVTLLGPADGERDLGDAPWQLLVPCSVGLLNWDVFFYWPGHRYPRRAYGGTLERIGDWAYVHE